MGGGGAGVVGVLGPAESPPLPPGTCLSGGGGEGVQGGAPPPPPRRRVFGKTEYQTR